jgi:hypothetical protein
MPPLSHSFDIPLDAVCVGAVQDANGWTYTPATPLLNAQLNPLFYFLRVGTFVITETVVLPGAPPQTESQTFVVRTASSPGVQVSLVPPSLLNAEAIALGDTVGNPGCRFQAQVSNPSPSSVVQAGFVQVVKAGRFVLPTEGGTRACPINGTWTLDAAPFNLPFYASLVNIPAGGTATVASYDSPSLGLTGMGGLSKAAVQDERFLTYICFRSAAPNSLVIPIVGLGWQWTAVAAVGADGQWALLPGSTSQADAEPTPNFQLYVGWTRAPGNLDWGDWKGSHCWSCGAGC